MLGTDVHRGAGPAREQRRSVSDRERGVALNSGRQVHAAALSEFDIRRIRTLLAPERAPKGNANSFAFKPGRPAEFMTQLIERANLPPEVSRSARERVDKHGMLLDGRSMAGGFNQLVQVMTKAGPVVARRRLPSVDTGEPSFQFRSVMSDAAALALVNRQRPGLAPELLYSDDDFMVTSLLPGVHPTPKPQNPGELWHHRWAHEQLPTVLPGLVADIATLELPEALMGPERVMSPVRMVDRARRYVDYMRRTHGAVFQSLGYTDDMIDGLRKFAAAFAPRVGATHNDLSFPNVLLQYRSNETAVGRVLDWDALCAGDPLLDFNNGLFRTWTDESKWSDMAADLERRLLPGHPDQGRGIQEDFPRGVAVQGAIKATGNIVHAAKLVKGPQGLKFPEQLDDISRLISERLRPAHRLLYGEHFPASEVRRRLTAQIPRNVSLIAVRGVSPVRTHAQRANAVRTAREPRQPWVSAFERDIAPKKRESPGRSFERSIERS